MLDRLAELGVLTPDADGYDPDDVAVIDAIARFRAGGYDEALGFTVYDTLRYRDALAPLVEREVEVLVERLGDVDPERAAAIVRAGREPLRELIGAMHSKMLLEALRRRTSTRGWVRGASVGRRVRTDCSPDPCCATDETTIDLPGWARSDPPPCPAAAHPSPARAWRSITPQPRRSSPPTGSAPANRPNGCLVVGHEQP